MSLTKTDTTVTNIPDISKSIKEDTSADGFRVYVDGQLTIKSDTSHLHSQYAPLSSPDFQGTPLADSPLVTDNSRRVATTSYVRSYTSSNYLPLTGGTLSNFLTLHADPTSNMHAATKKYVDDALLTVAGSSGGNTLLATYTTPGTYSFVVPSGVYTIYVYACAAGGGGGTGTEAGANYAGGGGGGGAGIANYKMSVTPGSVISITIGSGGLGGGALVTNWNPNAGYSIAGSAGGNTIFGSITLSGGSGGQPGTTAANGSGGAGGVTTLNSSYPMTYDGVKFVPPGTFAGSGQPGDSGTGSITATGGSGGRSIFAAGGAATTGTGLPGSLGSGGSGGGTVNDSSHKGGKGGDGLVYVYK